MLMTVTLLSLVPYGITLFHACIPNSQFHINGRVCRCDSMGRWSEASCKISRHQTCKPGQIVWEGCSQCICQENGHLMCTNTMCGDDATSKPTETNEAIDLNRLWCIPFVSYYVNCSLCVCPASGKMYDARCASDAACPFRGATDYLAAVKNNVCIPKVMYLFPCLHCLCSDDGFFIVSKCVETCQKAAPDVTRRCIPQTFYKKGCNVCFCPDNKITNKKLCTKAACSQPIHHNSLVRLRNKTRRCQRQMFTAPICFYCECNLDGTINEEACFESECLSIDNFKYNIEKATCSPGELVPKCIECFCLRNGYTNQKYCTNSCSNQQKLSILEISIKESFNNRHVIDRKIIKQIEAGEICDPKSIYKEQGRYCLCPDNGDTNFQLCTSMLEEHHTEKTKISIRETTVDIDFNVKCDPNTFVDFDCNTCYCLNTGRIDPKWCTYDDCEAKKIILKKQKSEMNGATVAATNGACSPGTILKEECNFCICPENGRLKDRACTKNRCAGVSDKINNGISCDPLTYYNVDCNICYCPKSGVKNVAKCTKSTCEKNFLRSEVCVPGKLFSEECNVCVCPPNGDKSDRVCTNNTCAEIDTPWKQIFQLSQSLMSNQKLGDTTRNLDLCFPGEEFEEGCKVCICPDMGLRMYATCTEMLCNDDKTSKKLKSDAEQQVKIPTVLTRRRDCMTVNYSESAERKECTPGSMYIIKCQQCICPYMGNIHNFCRPMPENAYCEQAFPGVNYVAMGRRNIDSANGTITRPSSNKERIDDQDSLPHPHTTWACDATGRVMDECFICDCNAGVIIEEHCFTSENDSCINSKPTFLKIKIPEQ